MTKEISLLLLLSTLFGCAHSQVQPGLAGDSSLQAFLPRWETAQSLFINGDPTQWKQNASHRADATVFGAFGGHEKGWNDCDQGQGYHNQGVRGYRHQGKKGCDELGLKNREAWNQ